MRTKAFVFIAAICALAVTAQAQTGAVYSLNVVGFQKIAPVPGKMIGSTPFDPASNNVNDAIGAQLTGGTSLGDADQIIFYNVAEQKYNTLYLRDNSGPPQIWGKWIDTDTGTIATNLVVPGQSWWVRNVQATTQTVVLVGDVVNDLAFTNEIIGGLQLLSYPYSTAIAVSNLNMSGEGAQGGTSLGDADQIILYNSSGQVYKTLYLRDNSGPPQIWGQWIDTDSGTLATDILEPGQGFWYRHLSNGYSWVESRPYTLE